MIKNYTVIDAHCHIYPEKIAARAVGGTDAFYGVVSVHDGTVAQLLTTTAAGVDRFIVQSVATTPHQVKSINEFIAAEVAASDGRLVGLGTLHPDSEDIDGDIRHLQELGLRGVKLHPDIQNFRIDDYRNLKIYERCEEAGLPILMHTGDNRYDNSNPNRLLPILEIYTGLTVIGAHFGGWSVWDEATKNLSKFENFYVDCSSSLYAMTPDEAKKLIYAYGTERVLFGTDYPMWEPSGEIERFMQLPLTEQEREDILCNNTARLLGIKSGQ